MQIAKKHMKRCSSLIIREMNTKTTVGYHLTSIRMAIIKNSANNKCEEDVKEREPSWSVGGNVNRYSHYREFCLLPLPGANCRVIYTLSFIAYFSVRDQSISGEEVGFIGRISLGLSRNKHNSETKTHTNNYCWERKKRQDFIVLLFKTLCLCQ